LIGGGIGKCQPQGMLVSRGGNGWDVDQIVPFQHPFLYFKTDIDANMDIV
jgi:hypothetical protein